MGHIQHLHKIILGQKGISIYQKGSQTCLSSSVSQIGEYNRPPAGHNNPQGEIYNAFSMEKRQRQHNTAS